jgi:hypothetical protein
MGEGKKKAMKIRFHEGLRRMRTDSGGIDVGASEIWVGCGGGK